MPSANHTRMVVCRATPSGDSTTCNITMLDLAGGVLLNHALRSDVRGTWGTAVDAKDHIWVAAQGWNSIVEVASSSNDTSPAGASTATTNSSAATVTGTTINATSINVPEYPGPAATLGTIIMVTLAIVTKKKRGMNSNGSHDHDGRRLHRKRR